ncbi:fumarate reductase subunit A [Alicyclobacillus acidoterrestris]|uniref:FAD-binding protein n=1 Tax=Alicyclobacillus suci TaxID=2816080 RepID=UPI001191B5DF|nr:FAD-binding protein [Alicyclobacillus suci]GEO26612.1 fumarate reductase subunit A [Alicyclobacillus acidoterrestris]
MQEFSADVVVVGAGAAGLMAARAASDAGASVILVDKSIVGRGGATILAQMTVAVALGDAEEDSPEIHAKDTIEGGRGLCAPEIVEAIVERGPEVILEVEKYGVHWAKTKDGKHSQVMAPGHSRKRCVYVDVLNTGGATSAGLRRATFRDSNIRRLKNVMITRLVKQDEEIVGAVGFSIESLEPVALTAAQVIIATGGLTEVYERNSATANMTGDGFVLAAEAGAELRDMEMVQFFPIAHLYPPLVGLDPIMWDPFRYKLGGRLLNGENEEFMHRYHGEVAGKYTAARDQTTLAIFEEVKAGRGSQHGGAYLDFRMVPQEALYEAFGPVIGILNDNGIDLRKDLVEVAPMAHFMIGGILVDRAMQTSVPGLLACGEAIRGMHGANRLSGNAITEALVTGRIAGETAAKHRHARVQAGAEMVHRAAVDEWKRLDAFWSPSTVATQGMTVLSLRRELQRVMWEFAGPLRTGEQLRKGLDEIHRIQSLCKDLSLQKEERFSLQRAEKVELWNMLQVSELIVRGAELRQETRGCHVRLDYNATLEEAKSTQFMLDDKANYTVQWSAQEGVSNHA